MKLTATKVYQPNPANRVTTSGVGLDSSGNTIVFEDEAVRMEALRDRIDAEGPVEIDISDFQVLSTIPPAATR